MIIVYINYDSSPSIISPSYHSYKTHKPLEKNRENYVVSRSHQTKTKYRCICWWINSLFFQCKINFPTLSLRSMWLLLIFCWLCFTDHSVPFIKTIVSILFQSHKALFVFHRQGETRKQLKTIKYIWKILFHQKELLMYNVAN